MTSQVKRPGAKSEGALGRFNRKFWDDPLVPVGCVLTGGVLIGGLWTLKTGQANLSQRFMRARIVAQGATVVVLCMGGVMMGNVGMKKPRDTYEDLMMKDKAAQRAGAMAQMRARPVPPSPPSH